MKRILTILLLFTLIASLTVIFAVTTYAAKTYYVVDEGGEMQVQKHQYAFFAFGLHWAFYCDNIADEMQYRTSSDFGHTWSDATIVADCVESRHFCLAYDETNNVLHYVRTDAAIIGGNGNIYYCAGTPNAEGGITWLAAEQDIGINSWHPMIVVDANGYPWIAYAHESGNDDCMVARSTTKNGTWTTDAPTYPKVIYGTGKGNGDIGLVAMPDGDILAAYGNPKLAVQRWESSTGLWGAASSSASDMEYNYSSHFIYYDAILDTINDDLVHFVFQEDVTDDSIYIPYTGSSFGAETTLQASIPIYDPNIMTDTSGDIYCFWADTPVDDVIYYNKYEYDTSSWSGLTEFYTLPDGYGMTAGGLYADMSAETGELGLFNTMTDDVTGDCTLIYFPVLEPQVDTIEPYLVSCDPDTGLTTIYLRGNITNTGFQTTKGRGFQLWRWDAPSWTYINSLSTDTSEYAADLTISEEGFWGLGVYYLTWDWANESTTYRVKAGVIGSNNVPTYDEYSWIFTTGECATTQEGNDTESTEDDGYTPEGGVIVYTRDAHLVTSSTATLRGEIIDTGNTTCTERGFIWGTSSGGADFGDYSDIRLDDSTPSYGTGIFTHPVTGLPPCSTIYKRAIAYNEAGWSMGAEYRFDTSDTLPNVETQDTAYVTMNSAVINAYLDDDGCTPCDMRFQWGIGDDSTYTSWRSGYTEGESIHEQLTGLTPSTTYWYISYARNGIGIDTGGNETFTTLGNDTVTHPTSCSAVPRVTEPTIDLSWNRVEGVNFYTIRYKLGECPSSVTDGTLVKNIAQAYNSTSHEGLQPGVTFYYSIWGKAGANTSASYCCCYATTTSAGAEAAETPPDVPSTWFGDVDPTVLDWFPMYPGFNVAFDDFGIPRATGWLIIFFFFLTAVGVGAYSGQQVIKTGVGLRQSFSEIRTPVGQQSLLFSMIIMLVIMGVASGMGFLPTYWAILFLIVVMGVGVVIRKL